ncbi:armadillo-type protein [Mycena olivaceomarginata]|nr:armadillo-type protein [Mycena olivaceomarginata]
MIFRETFGHFADLIMTDPFGNYLCQKLLEYSTDEQRSVICDSVAQDLVNISLNMHGTRTVQKMIDFLSTRRQADARYNAQIHSIIVALSLHVMVLIMDLNGNHVIQKCLNKLAPEDNQFIIYNAVAASCIEAATHHHGCCVLQRCFGPSTHSAIHQGSCYAISITLGVLQAHVCVRAQIRGLYITSKQLLDENRGGFDAF